MLYFLLPPLLYFLITARNLELFIRLRKEKEGRGLNLFNSFLLLLVLIVLYTCLVRLALR